MVDDVDVDIALLGRVVVLRARESISAIDDSIPHLVAIDVVIHGFLISGRPSLPALMRAGPAITRSHMHGGTRHVGPTCPWWPPMAPTVMTSWGRLSVLLTRAEAADTRKPTL